MQATEGSALKCNSTSYYDGLRDRLDLVLTFTEHGSLLSYCTSVDKVLTLFHITDACEATFSFTVLQDLLETQTITSCSQIFSWIESSAARLTKDMIPQKGKALILLRTLNDLLRRLSKMGSTTIFCGRILTFLSGVFPLGERSGVNLRGEYGPIWEGVKETEKMDEDVTMEAAKGPENGDKMEIDGGKKDSADTKDKDGRSEFLCYMLQLMLFSGFYTTFWSLQLPFSRPPLFAFPNTFAEFKDAVDKVLPVIKEATTKERAMMGNRGASGASSSLKRKREPELGEASNNSEYFFAKFLTSPELLNLEVYARLFQTCKSLKFRRLQIPIFVDKSCSNSLSSFTISCHSHEPQRLRGVHPGIDPSRWTLHLNPQMLNGSMTRSQKLLQSCVPRPPTALHLPTL